jgi:hypothetical protein
MEAPTCPNEAEDKDLLELDRLMAVVNLQKYQAKTEAWRYSKVRPKAFEVRDLVLLRSPCTESSWKLESKWVGPYAVMEKSRPWVYRLSDTQGKMLEHLWNVFNLCRFYV